MRGGEPPALERIAAALERVAAALERMADGDAAEPGTLLPDDFPGREALAERGIVYLESVPRQGAALMALGLDGAIVNRMLTRLKRDG